MDYPLFLHLSIRDILGFIRQDAEFSGPDFKFLSRVYLIRSKVVDSFYQVYGGIKPLESLSQVIQRLDDVFLA